MKPRGLQPRSFFCTLLLCASIGGLEPGGLCAQSRRKHLDGNLRCVDLSDLKRALPLTIVSTKRILEQSEAWEKSTWNPGQQHSLLGYPSLVRNDHGPGSDGKYYLYFANHKESYIRQAYADDLKGPWVVHPPGSLQLADSLFPRRAAGCFSVSRGGDQETAVGVEWIRDDAMRHLGGVGHAPHCIPRCARRYRRRDYRDVFPRSGWP